MVVSSLWLTILVLFVVSSLLIHVAQRARIRQLETRLQQVNRQQDSIAQDSMSQDQLAYLRELAKTKDKVAAIKALREQYPELSLVQAVQLWQQR